MRLKESTGILAQKRLNALHMLNDILDDWSLARVIEMGAHAISSTTIMYSDKMHQIIHNINLNKELASYGASIVLMSDKRMAQDTIIEDIEKQTMEKQKRFEAILQEKYDMVNRDSYKETLKCRRCGSSEVQWEQKQTRGADEAMTVFCTCSKCQQRWTMR